MNIEDSAKNTQGDLISREALRKSVTDELERLSCVLYKHNDYYLATTRTIQTILNFIDNAPTVKINTNDIEYKAYCKGLEDGKKIARPQGEWGKHGECPFCSYVRQWEDDKFCGNCGAKMQKGGAE